MSTIVSESHAKSKRGTKTAAHIFAFISISIFGQVTHRRVYYCHCSRQYTEMITSFLQNQTACTFKELQR